MTKVNKAFTTTTRAGNAIIRNQRAARSRGGAALQARKTARGLLRGARQEKRSGTEGTDLLTRAVPVRGRGRQQVLRRGHRQPHDLPDDGRPRHLDVDADDDGRTTWPPTRSGRTAAATSPTGSATARWTSRRSRSWKRYDLVMNESIRMVTPAAVGDAPDGARHRPARLLHAQAGTNVIDLPGDEPPAARDSGPIRRSSTRTASPSRATSTSSTATRSRRSAAARTSASAWCSASSRSRPIMHRLLRRYRLELVRARLQAALRLRRHAGPDRRHADRAAPAALTRLRRNGICGTGQIGSTFNLCE